MSDQVNTENTDRITSESAQNGPGTASEEVRTQEKSREYSIKEITRQNYAVTVAHLHRYSEDKRARDGSKSEWFQITPIDLIQDLAGRDDLKASTRDVYSFALKRHFEDNAHIPEFQQALEELNRLAKIRKDQAKALRGSVRKSTVSKAIPKADLHILLEHLTDLAASRKSNSKWPGRAQRFFLAILATGIRPGEWETARWTDDAKSAVQVTNGKQKADTPGFMRSEGVDEDEREEDGEPKIRVIPVSSTGDRMAIDWHLNMLQETVHGGQFSMLEYRERCGQVIKRACLKLWPNNPLKHYSLYTARKQFQANQKAAVGNVRTAELMGHSRPDSPSASYYGKANQAYSRTGGNYRKKESQTQAPSQVAWQTPTSTQTAEPTPNMSNDL